MSEKNDSDDYMTLQQHTNKGGSIPAFLQEGQGAKLALVQPLTAQAPLYCFPK
jgi:hypothetical protein